MKKFTKTVALMLACMFLLSFSLIGCKTDSGEDGKLAQTASITYADGTLSWAAVEGAESYDVTVYEKGSSEEALETQTVTKTTLDVSLLAAGEYTAGVIAKAEGKTAGDEKKADFTVAEALSALDTPTGFAYADGKVTWTAVAGAKSGYNVTVTKKSDGSSVINKDVTAAELDVSELEAGEYTLSVKAKAVDGEALESLAATYDFTVAAAKTKLTAPSGGAVDVAARKVTWTAVDGATAYEVEAEKDGDTLLSETVTTAEVDISDVEETEFTITVTATGDPSTTEPSDAYVYEVKINAVPIAAPSGIDTDAAQNTLSWDEVAGSDAYQLTIKKGNETIVSREQIETSYDISSLGAGEYAVQVQTLADPDDIFVTDSSVTDYTLNIVSLGEFDEISGLRIDGGYFRWDENNALGYEVTVTEKGESQALDLKGITASNNSFMIAGIGLPTGDYTFTITPADNRHDTAKGTAASYDITLTVVRTFDAKAIAAFDGSFPVGEHAKAELVTYNQKEVAKVTPTADGWGRVGSPAVTVNFDTNAVLYIDIEGIEVGGFHAQIQVGGNNVKVLDDGAKLADVAIDISTASLAAQGLSGSKSSIIRLGVDNSSSTTANDAVAYYNSCSIMYIADYTPPFSGQLASVSGYTIANGMDISWNAVDNADSYYFTLVNDEGITVQEKTVTESISFSAKDLEADTYTLKVSAFNSTNDQALESETTEFSFKVNFIKEYSAEEIAAFTQVFAGEAQTVGYDADTDTAVYNPNKDKGYGAVGPAEGVQVNLTNMPFAKVDVDRIDHGYLIRGGWTPDGGIFQTLVLRNDTVAALEDSMLYIELWKKADQDGAPVYGTGTYQFGMGFLAGEVQGQARINKITLVEITEVTELVPGANQKLETPSGAQESKGTLSANPVSGNSEYTPTYRVTVAEKGGSQLYDRGELASPSVNLYELALVGGKTYEVTFVAEGDTGAEEQNYFADSDPYTVEIVFEEIVAIDDFTALDYATMESQKGGETTIDYSDGTLVSTVKNGGWGYNFFNIDISGYKDDLTNDYYLQWKIDLDRSTAGANVATRFYNPATEKAEGTGWGDSDLQSAYLTKEWNGKIDETDTIWFAFGQGGANVSQADGSGNKVVVLESMSFVKYTLIAQA